MIPAHRVEAVLGEGGTLHLPKLPFGAGQCVDVYVFPHDSAGGGPEALRGAVLRYDRPFDPVDEQQWDAAR